jgi:hypothetical protein
VIQGLVDGLLLYIYIYMVHNMYVSVARDKMLNLSVISLA